MKQIQYILVACILCVSVGHAQPDTLWTSVIRNAGLGSVIRTSDLGYAISGCCYPGAPRRDTDQQVVKTDSLGREEWRNHYSVTPPDSFQANEDAYTLQQLSNGGFFLGGSGPGGAGAMIVRTDSVGNQIWATSWEWNEFTNFHASALADDDHVVVIDDWSAIEFDVDGGIVWQQRCALTQRDLLTRIARTRDGGYIATGVTYGLGNGSGEFFAAKIDQNGEVEWRNAYGTDEYYEIAYGVAQTQDGGYCFVGHSEQNRTPHGMVVRTDSEGAEIWRHSYNDGDQLGQFKRVVGLSDGGIALASASVQQFQYGSFVLDRLDKDGEFLWEVRYIVGEAPAAVKSLLLMEDGGYTIAGPGGGGVWLVRTERDPSLPADVVLLDPAFPSLIALEAPYPNPFNAQVTIGFELPAPNQVTLKVFDEQYREVATLMDGEIAAGYHQIVWNAFNSPSGLYFARIESGETSRTVKLLLSR